MQSFTCPFCGSRDEREFHFQGEAGKIRPDTTKEISDADWTNYLFNCENAKGVTQEVWVHTPCQEYFIMERDSVSMDVLNVIPMRKESA